MISYPRRTKQVYRRTAVSAVATGRCRPSDGELTIFPPITSSDEPPPSKLTASTTSMPIKKRANSSSIMPLLCDCLPSRTANITLPFFKMPTAVRGAFAPVTSTPICSCAEVISTCPSFTKSGPTPKISVALFHGSLRLCSICNVSPTFKPFKIL